jgi:hypothetical protein
MAIAFDCNLQQTESLFADECEPFFDSIGQSATTPPERAASVK